jgi:hypothetical protein
MQSTRELGGQHAFNQCLGRDRPTKTGYWTRCRLSNPLVLGFESFVCDSSLGGMVSEYRLFVADRFHGHIPNRELAALISRRFDRPVRCYDPFVPNVAGIGWDGESHRLWMAVQVPGYSNCESMETFKAYLFDPVTMTIVRECGFLQSKDISVTNAMRSG